jgi:3-isopropylmalate dehydratase small subunit
MLPIVLEGAEIDYFFSLDADNYVEVNLMEQTLSTDKKIINFKIDPMKRRMLLEGTDEIDYTLQLEDRITNYEKKYDR